ncbi:MAG: DUF998 domain-containing protein [archaeon]|nr:DUF998 domain-containing protein [archaeon]
MESKNDWRNSVYIYGMFTAIQFVVLTIIAMLVYPGGTYYEHDTVGYNFFENYFSDLGRTITHSGADNTVGWAFFTLSICIGGSSIALFFIAVLKQFKEKEKAKWFAIPGSILGIICGISFIGIGLAPSDTLHELHLLFVYMAFGLAFITAAFYTIAGLKNPDYPRKATYALLIFSICIFLYLILMFWGPSEETAIGLFIQATGQKLIVYLLIIVFFIQAYTCWKISKKTPIN